MYLLKSALAGATFATCAVVAGTVAWTYAQSRIDRRDRWNYFADQRRLGELLLAPTVAGDA